MMHVSVNRWGGLGWGRALFCVCVCVFYINRRAFSSFSPSSMNQEWNNEQFVWMDPNDSFCAHKYFIVVILTKGDTTVDCISAPNLIPFFFFLLLNFGYLWMTEHSKPVSFLSDTFSLFAGVLSLSVCVCVYFDWFLFFLLIGTKDWYKGKWSYGIWKCWKTFFVS